ncbi:MAG: ACT domain-containing protein, partial [Steroidobacteraceae bacterium]
ETTLRRVVSDRELSPQAVTRRVARQLKVFTTRTGVSFSRDSSGRWTILELVSADRPGLLSEIGKVLWQQGLNLLGAKIMTVGERAEDVFYLTDGDGSLLTPERQQVVTDALIAALDRRGAAA